VNPLHPPMLNGDDDRPTLVSNVTRLRSQAAKIKMKGFYYFLPYVPTTLSDKFKTMKRFSKLFYFALIPKESYNAHLSATKFSFHDIRKISTIPNYFMQRLTAKAEWYQKLFKDSVKKPDIFQNTKDTVSRYNFSIFSPRMGSQKNINITDVVWDKKFQLIQVSYDENSSNPDDTLTFLLRMIESVIYEFHYGLKVLSLVSYQSEEDEKLYLYSLKHMKKHFAGQFLPTASVQQTEQSNKEIIPDNVSLPRLLLSLFSDPTSASVTQATKLEKKMDLKKTNLHNYMFGTLRKSFYFYFQFYYESAVSKAIVHISCPPTPTEPKVNSHILQRFRAMYLKKEEAKSKEKSDIQKYFTSNLETTFHEVYGKFCTLYPGKEAFTCSDRPVKLSDDSWISTFMFSQHLLLIYRLKDFEALETANGGTGTPVVLTEDLEIVLYEWIIIIVFMKYFYKISHIKSFRIVLLSNEEEVTPSKNFFHEFFPSDIKFQNTPFNQTTLQSLKTKLKTYYQTMTTDYSLKHHLQNSYLTKLDNYFESLTIPNLVMEFSHLVSMNYHSFAIMKGDSPYKIDKTMAGNFLYFTHLDEADNVPPTDLPVSNLFDDLKYFAVERLHPKERKPCFKLCRCITLEGKLEDYVEKYQQLLSWIGIVTTILFLSWIFTLWETTM
jgi:hypothetical protein